MSLITYLKTKVLYFLLFYLVNITFIKVVENPQWLSPEVLMGKSYNHLADVFAFGIIMWEILTRQIVFEEIRFQFQLEDEIMKGSRPHLPSTLDRKEKVVDEYVKIMQVCS